MLILFHLITLFTLNFWPRFVDRDMMMRFRGGGVGHSSTRAASDIFKNDRDELDITSQRALIELRSHSNMEEDDGMPVDDGCHKLVDELKNDMNIENLDGEGDIDEIVDEEGQLSDMELFDYGYKLPEESESSSEEDDDEDDDNATVGELGTLEYGDY